MSLVINGTNQYALCNLTTLINGADPFSIAFTFKTGASVTGSLRTVFALTQASGNWRGFGLSIRADGKFVAIQATGSEQEGSSPWFNVTAQANTIYECVLTKAAGSAGEYKGYINEITNTYARSAVTNSNVMTRFCLGAAMGNSAYQFFGGKIARVAFWPSVLSTADINVCLNSMQTPANCSVSPQDYWIAVANDSPAIGSNSIVRFNSAVYDSDSIVNAFVNDINGSSSNPAIDVSSSNTANTTGLGTITTLTINDGTRSLAAIPSMPSGDGTFTFTWPYADGVVAPLFGSVTATFGDSTNSAAMVGNTPIPAGFASVTFAGATDISEYHLGHVLTLTDSKRMYYPTTNGAVINSDGSLEFTTLPYTLNAMLHNVHSGGDGTITSVTVTITESGAVVVPPTTRPLGGRPIRSSLGRQIWPITPHATNPVGGSGETKKAYGIKVSGAGTVVIRTEGGDEDVTITLAAGATLPVVVTHIRDTSTATGILGYSIY